MCFCRKHLAKLREVLDSTTSNISEEEKDLVHSAVARYGDLVYELSGLVMEVITISIKSIGLY